MKIARKLNPRKLKLAKVIKDRSVLSACMHTVLHIQNLPNLLFLSAEIHEVPVLHRFIVLCTLWIALPTNYKAFWQTRERGKNRPQCESVKVNNFSKSTQKRPPRKKRALQYIHYWIRPLFKTICRFFNKESYILSLASTFLKMKVSIISVSFYKYQQ